MCRKYKKISEYNILLFLFLFNTIYSYFVAMVVHGIQKVAGSIPTTSTKRELSEPG